jgi:hypothetical protein
LKGDDYVSTYSFGSSDCISSIWIWAFTDF